MSAFKLLYENKIVHRDLKPENIMISKGMCKLTDFGFSKYVEDFENYEMSTCVGTPVYMAPQILARSKYTTKCDIWSLGVIFYCMLVGNPPWEGRNNQELEHKIRYQRLYSFYKILIFF